MISTTMQKPASASDGQNDVEVAALKQTEDTSIIHDLLNLKGKDALTIAQAFKELASRKDLCPSKEVTPY
jgi:alpha-mannosidase